MTEYESLYELFEAFPTEESCIAHLEAKRWPRGVICPHCGSSRKMYRVARVGGYKCADCKRGFSIRKHTIFERSPLPLRKWFAAIWLATSHRKGIPSTQLAREIGVTQKTAWYMLGRIREVMGEMAKRGGPVSGQVEADETFIGGKQHNKHRRQREREDIRAGTGGKQPVAGARDRTGRVTAAVIPDTTKPTLHGFIARNVAHGSTLYTDEHRGYQGLERIGYGHLTVRHSIGEYVREEAHTNGVESFWALLKRGYVGTFHHFTWKHLHRYLDEFTTRYNFGKASGSARVDAVLAATSGSSLTYKELIAA